MWGSQPAAPTPTRHRFVSHPGPEMSHRAVLVSVGCATAPPPRQGAPLNCAPSPTPALLDGARTATTPQSGAAINSAQGETRSPVVDVDARGRVIQAS